MVHLLHRLYGVDAPACIDHEVKMTKIGVRVNVCMPIRLHSFLGQIYNVLLPATTVLAANRRLAVVIACE